ncbi:MAG: tripartite tricarboxylate transporter substrate binding protein [Burkholderiales bacterium]|nr:tripartite tricarboxylate transporter substrate binding protein [Burkholderiales bacterium]
MLPIIVASLAAVAASDGTAQTYPSRPIRLLVPFPPGGTPDSNARAVTAAMERGLGQNIVVDNRAGANGIVGMETVAHAPPNGYTFLYTTVAFIINPAVHKHLPFDVVRDFAPVTNVALGLGYVIVVNAAVPAKSVRELIALARGRDKPLGYGTSGVGNPQQIAGELFNTRAGTALMHVPYKGAAQAMIALLGGEVQAMFMPPTSALPHIKSGKLRVLAYTAAKRWSAMPDVPTVVEAGVPGYQFDGAWHGIFAPAKAPPAMLARFQSEVRKAIETPQVRDFLVAGGFEPIGNTPEEFRQFVATELKKWAELAKIAGLKPE